MDKSRVQHRILAKLSPKQRVYRDFFRQQVKDAGVDHPFELTGKDLTKFFEKVKKDYRNLKRRNEYQERVKKYEERLGVESSLEEYALFGPKTIKEWVETLTKSFKKYSGKSPEFGKPYREKGSWAVDTTLTLKMTDLDWLDSIARAIARCKGEIINLNADGGVFTFSIKSPIKAV